MAIAYIEASLMNDSNHSQKSYGSSDRVRRPRPASRNSENDSLNTGSWHSISSNDSDRSSRYQHNYKPPVLPPHSQYVALDCEMVGSIAGKSMCARVVLVDWKGRTMLDTYVQPMEQVADYRTFVSGITAADLQDAPSLDSVRAQVAKMLHLKILVGHGLTSDLECLGITHPWSMIRDTAYYEPFMKMHEQFGTLVPCKLKQLAADRLQKNIQELGKSHCPTEDAIAALDLYKSHRPRWEACVLSKIKESQRQVRAQVLVMQQQHRQQMMLQQQYHNHFAYAMPLGYA